MVLRITTKIGVIVTSTHLPKITVQAVAAAARARTEQLQAKLAEQGITVTADEASTILDELLSKPDTQRKLKELERGLIELIPVLTRLSHVLHR